MSTKVFLFGAHSMLGWSLLQTALQKSVIPFCARQTKYTSNRKWHPLNLEDENRIRELFQNETPELLVHCGGICNVEKCQKSPEFAYRVNVFALEILLRYLPQKTRLVYCSSDHVFSGDTGPYKESSVPDPISIYGKTRVKAEQLILSYRKNALIIRPGLWIGDSYNGRIGHLDWLRSRHKRNLPMTVVQDEYRPAMWAKDAAQRFWALADSRITGIRHITTTQSVSRVRLAEYLNRYFSIGATLCVQSRSHRTFPHLGRIELQTEFLDKFSAPLPSVVSNLP